MESFTKLKINRFLSNAIPVENGWYEKKEVFKLGENLYPVEDNFPHWTKSDIREFCRLARLPVVEVTVKLTIAQEIPKQIKR